MSRSSRLLVYGCSFSAGAKTEAEKKNSPPEKNYVSVAGVKLGYESIVLCGVGGATNQLITNTILKDISTGKIEPTDDIIVQQTSHWRKNIGDTRFDAATMDIDDVINYNHNKYANGDFLNEILHHRTMSDWYILLNQYPAWTAPEQLTKKQEVHSIVQKSLSEWDLILTNFCFMASTLNALAITGPGRKIFALPFVPLVDDSYNKFMNNIDGHTLLQLLYSDWEKCIDSNRSHILTVNPMNHYYNNKKYWDPIDGNRSKFRIIDHSTDEFHAEVADILYKQMKVFYD